MKQDFLTTELKTAIQEHAVREYPKESLGAIIGDQYVELLNISPTPELNARMSKVDTMELVTNPEFAALVHSHPNGPNFPSESDMRSQLAMAKPFIIVATDGGGCLEPFLFGDEVEIPTLAGRAFRHGVTDCYSLIRDWYRLERNITIPEYPRNWEWWTSDQNLYEDNFTNAGFLETEGLSDLQQGDVLLAKIRSTKINHAGIYLGKGLMLHHATGRNGWDPTRLSKKDPIERWKDYIVKVVRYKGEHET